MTTFDNTRNAMREYEAGRAARNDAWHMADTDKDIEACEAADKEALQRVQDAYYEDTKAFNSLEDCRRIAYDDIRRIVPYPKH